jgi:lipoic acid synthetase
MELQAHTVPAWLKKKLIVNSENLSLTKKILAEFHIKTVCESSLCPNTNECFSKKYATFLILGPACTRSCGFCCVEKGSPGAIDPGEPGRIARAVKKMALKYVVVTSVTRDDLPDGGSGQYVRIIKAIKKLSAEIKTEVLVPDFKGRQSSIEKVANAGADVFSHNIETISRLYAAVRKGADYKRSLIVLKMAKYIAPDRATKSSILVGLGETEEEVRRLMADIKETGCDILAIGQYLRPSKDNLPVKRFVTPEEFAGYKDIGKRIGFKAVMAGPFVRSSYMAENSYPATIIKRTRRDVASNKRRPGRAP